MPFEKSVLVPLNADETFALITQPDRLRRWQVITARVDLRAGGEYRTRAPTSGRPSPTWIR
jgi:uncharacterized protein YndB with AHSA1/START domain